MPTENILLTPVTTSPSPAITSLINAVSLESRAMAKTISPSGGVTIDAVREVLEPVLVDAGLTRATRSSFSPASLSWLSEPGRAAVTIQAGRAHVNNGVLEAVLSAAAHPGVDWLIAVFPERYKSGKTFVNVQAQTQELSSASGVRLDLVGVSLIGF